MRPGATVKFEVQRSALEFSNLLTISTKNRFFQIFSRRSLYLKSVCYAWTVPSRRPYYQKKVGRTWKEYLYKSLDMKMVSKVLGFRREIARSRDCYFFGQPRRSHVETYCKNRTYASLSRFSHSRAVFLISP